MRLALVINTIAPYRLPIYVALAERFDLEVMHGGNEGNRSWALNIPPSLKTRKVWTLQIAGKKHTGVAGVTDRRYVHLNLGLLWRLPIFRPDAVLSNELGLRTILSLAYAKIARIPLWVWWGGTLHSERFVGNFKRKLRSAVCRHIDHWISYGATSTEYLESIGVPRDRVLQIQNCVPHENFTVAPSEPQPWFQGEPRPVILTVGQLIARKGLGKLIEACGRLARRGLDFTLVMVGNGPERDRLAEQAKLEGIEHCVILPNQSQATLNELYRAAEVFVFPTLEDVWGLVVNEALWAGTSVLCSQYAGCAKEIVPEENVFDPMSADSFDAALDKVFSNTVSPADRTRLLTWQQVSDMIATSIEKGKPIQSSATGTIAFEHAAN